MIRAQLFYDVRPETLPPQSRLRLSPQHGSDERMSVWLLSPEVRQTVCGGMQCLYSPHIG
jgi:hypothetical protein